MSTDTVDILNQLIKYQHIEYSHTTQVNMTLGKEKYK